MLPGFLLAGEMLPVFLLAAISAVSGLGEEGMVLAEGYNRQEQAVSNLADWHFKNLNGIKCWLKF